MVCRSWSTIRADSIKALQSLANVCLVYAQFTFGSLKSECDHISEGQEKIPGHKQIFLKKSYLHSKVVFVWGTEKLTIIFIKIFNGRDDPFS